uniref:Uncharacterized protein n=1 Tax=Arundo donax TaxID=35708 RepID=A0A0A9EXU3_ARUDO
MPQHLLHVGLPLMSLS